MVNQRRSEDGVLPDYSDDDLPDYSDDEAANAATR